MQSNGGGEEAGLLAKEREVGLVKRVTTTRMVEGKEVVMPEEQKEPPGERGVT